MNFKKNQRRIPMNYKKIIPLSFAALSVAGALSACSDSTVVGADVQGNSIALSSSSGVGPGSSSSFDVNRESSDLVALLNRVGNDHAVTIYHVAGDTSQSNDPLGNYRSIFHYDSVDAYTTYNDVVEEILEAGSIRYVVNDIINDFDFDSSVCSGVTSCNQVYYETEVAMIDKEHNHMRWPLFMSYGGHGNYGQQRLQCSQLELKSKGYSIGFREQDSGLVVLKSLVTRQDHEMYEEFKADCALENGEYMDYLEYFPEYVGYPGIEPPHGGMCFVKPEMIDGVPTYKDPHWAKNAKYVIDSCADMND